MPVLLPFDTAAFLEARLNGAPSSLSLARYQADFRPADLFDAGPAGYDAVFSLEPGAGDGMPQRTFARPVEVQITGSNLIYDISDPLGGKGEPVKSLMAQFPDLRRFIREGYVRYAFTRFGVPYVVSIQCLELDAARAAAGLPRGLSRRRTFPEGAARRRRPAVAAAPRHTVRRRRTAGATLRRLQLSPGRRHHRQHRLPQAGRPRRLHRLFADPLSAGEGPGLRAFAILLKRRAREKTDEPAGGNRPGYPWQDNFCEARSFGVGQCAGGFGHQGQDIRAGECPGASDGRDKCDPRQQGVVAVRDGVVIRSPKQQAATLQVNSRTEHIRFRYMHMNPASLDADGVLNGRVVAEGEKIGVVSNYLDHPNGTSRHLHFDVQVFTRDGWLWVNPYVTLISAYERLIRGRGRELGTAAAIGGRRGACPAGGRASRLDAKRAARTDRRRTGR